MKIADFEECEAIGLDFSLKNEIFLIAESGYILGNSQISRHRQILFFTQHLKKAHFYKDCVKFF